MSYIRSTSNPENLYSWDDIDGNIYFHWNDRKNKQQKMFCLSTDFNEFMLKVKKCGDYVIFGEHIVHNNISIYEVIYNVSRDYICKKSPWKNGKFPRDKFDHLICLQIGDKKLLMFDVTWDRVYENYFSYKSIRELFCSLVSEIYYRTKNWLFNIYYLVKEKILRPEEK